MNKYIIDDYLVFNKNVEKWKNKLSIYQNGTIVINSEKNVVQKIVTILIMKKVVVTKLRKEQLMNRKS